MQKNFDVWNEEKKIVDKKDIGEELFFHEREIWWCSTGLNIGVETNGKSNNFERPMLIIKKFNKEMVWGLPMTTQGKNGAFQYKIRHQTIDSWVMLSQLKTLSTKRLLRKVGSVSVDDFYQVISLVRGFLDIESSRKGAFSEAEATNASSIDKSKN